MAEEKPQGVKSAISGWLKAAVTSIVGLASGAALMYLTPLVNNAIKPAKPVANFAMQIDGLNVQFNNRSTGGSRGWWDFGDGTALEPFDPGVDMIKHAYAKPGKYEVKLVLQNLINEEAERTIALTLDAAVPEITSFQLFPVSPSDRAPVTYRLTYKVKNASFCILSAGDDKPMEILDDPNQERYVTFNEMGAFTVRLAAVNGKQLAEKSQPVYVSPNDGTNTLVAKLAVSYEAVKVDRMNKDWRITCDWPADVNASVYPFRKERPAFAGSTIVGAELLNPDTKNTAVRNARVEVAPDKSRVILSGELVKPSGFLAPRSAPSWVANVRIVTERRSQPQTVNLGEVAMALSLNTPTKLPMQALGNGWEVTRKSMKIELWDGTRKVWDGSGAVANAKVPMKNQTCLLTVSPQNDGVLLRLDGATTNVPPVLTPVTHLPPPSPAVTPPITHLPPTERLGPTSRPVGFERQPFMKPKSK